MATLSDILYSIDHFEYIQEFEEKQVTGDTLRTLTHQEINNIVYEDDVDDFMKKRDEYFAKLDRDANEASLDQAAHNQQRQDANQARINETINGQQIPLAERNDNQNEARVGNTSIFITENLNIEQILKNTYEGRQILQYYALHKQLTKQKRKKLVWYIISTVLNTCTRELQDQDYIILRDKIIALFPTEIGSIYFTPTQYKNKLTNTEYQKRKGKLVNKFYNLKKGSQNKLKDCKENENEVVNPEVEESQLSEELLSKIEWLQSNEEPWETTINHWASTYDYRKSKIGDKCNKISSIYEEWTILKTPKGYTLINVDFQKSQICNIDNAITGFTDFFQKAYNVRPLRDDDLTILLKELLKNKDLSEDSKFLIHLHLICLMLPPVAKIRQANKKFWKPTSSESLDGIIKHIKIYGDIKKAKEDRKAYAASKNITVQPYIIVVGEEDYVVNSAYVCIDNFEYEMNSLQEAIDLCFKSFHTFQAKYPPESEHIWLLLQLGLYKFRTKWDKIILDVEEILNDMRIALPPAL